MDTLRESAFPNILSLKFTAIEDSVDNTGAEKFKEGRTILDNFKEFFINKAGQEFDSECEKAMTDFLQKNSWQWKILPTKFFFCLNFIFCTVSQSINIFFVSINYKNRRD